MSLFRYIKSQLRMLFRGPTKSPAEARARHLAQLDRQLTPQEWEEFSGLVKEGHLD